MNQDEFKIILRHDVDNPFVYRKGLFNKLMNRVYLSNTKLPRNENLPGYLSALQDVLELENRSGATGTFFFRTVTCPSLNLVKEMKEKGHEISFHADRIDSFQEFEDDLNELRNKTNCQISGFTKHGYAKVRSGGGWDESKMIEYAKNANLKYLAQGEDHHDWEEPHLVDGVYVFGHHLTIKKASKEELNQYIESHKWPLLMLHPEDLFIDGVKEKFIMILKKAKVISIEESLKLIS